MERTLGDGRVMRVSEQPMDGGGWVSTHEDFTEQKRAARILERTERFLATVVENVTEAITAKDARDLRYIFVNKAAEKLLGLPRTSIIGKSARDLFPLKPPSWSNSSTSSCWQRSRPRSCGSNGTHARQ